ncbi:MAG: metal-dependent hydrolase [Candidatus Accumulibacter sp.]|jgi:L-ascorbate metabolism protein UlaG (beta-lactamase superfamily)|nr:metal-dependent hydrolase [Accumulibacter sp.]
MKIKYLGHSCFLISTETHTLIVDPFLSGNPGAGAKPGDVNPTHVLVTHGHDDHFGDAAEIAGRCGATVYATVETAGRFPPGINIEVGQPGGFVASDFGGVKFTTAAHGSGVPGGLACGFLIRIDGKKVYHAGDTGLIADMALLEYERVDVALLPIGDRFTMGPRDAARAVGMIKPRIVVPMHYDTWPMLKQDPAAFKKEVEGSTGARVVVLAVGAEFEP